MADYLQYCHDSGQVAYEPTRALDFARKVVGAVPDFSWGWSAISNAAMLESTTGTTSPDAEARRIAGLAAVAKALQLDPNNSEALGNKSLLIDQNDLIGREQLLKHALAARPQSCGCEHFYYGSLLKEVGRFSAATEQLRRATELNPLDVTLQWGFANLLLTTGRGPEAKARIDAVIDLSNDPDTSENVAINTALMTGHFRSASDAFRDPAGSIPPAEKAAFRAALEALRSGDPAARSEAIKLLTSTRFGGDGDLASNLLGALGANVEALKVVSDEAAARTWAARSWLFYPSMRSALSDPSFPAIAEKLGLTKYWKTTRTKPDVCSSRGAPPFCNMI
jgi:hypothetical protein